MELPMLLGTSIARVWGANTAKGYVDAPKNWFELGVILNTQAKREKKKSKIFNILYEQ